MLKNIDKRKVLLDILIYAFTLVISFSLTRIELNGNCFVFIVPFILFCFLNDKWLGYFASIVSFFFIGSYNKWFYLSFLIVVAGVFFFKFLIKIKHKKMRNILGFYCFGIVFVESIICLFVYNSNAYVLAFLLAICSYWMMCYFYDLYVSMHVSENRYLSAFSSVFLLFIIGVSFLGLKTNFWEINFSLIGIILIAFIASKIGLEVGVLYSFLLSVIIYFVSEIEVSFILFIASCLIGFFLRKESKLTLLFVYGLAIGAIVYYFDLKYLEGICCFVGCLFYCLIPKNVMDKICRYCFGSEKYIEKVIKDNKSMNMEISKKIIKMEEVFSLVLSKISSKGRIRKCEKELLISEINVFDDIVRGFAHDVKNNYDGSSYYGRVEKEIYKYGIDMLYFDVNEDVFGDKIININVRCDKKDIDNIVVFVINKVMKQNFRLIKVKKNDLFEFYELTLKNCKGINFHFGVNQRAKEENVCGDSYLVYENSQKKIFALSDGMGTGKSAREKSKEMLELFRKFMDVGFDEISAINSINCILKNGGVKESYATLDLFVYDKYTHEFYFCKNGACSSYLLGEDKIEVVEGDELPIGIMDKIEVKKRMINACDFEYVVMVSDGVSESKLELLKTLKTRDPQKMARVILGESAELIDDETILIIEIKK